MRDLLEQLLGAALMADVIRIEPFLWSEGLVTMDVTTPLFTDETFRLTLSEDEWEGGPNACVAHEIAKALRRGELTPKPVIEKN